jgi:hypothetical protein
MHFSRDLFSLKLRAIGLAERLAPMALYRKPQSLLIRVLFSHFPQVPHWNA